MPRIDLATYPSSNSSLVTTNRPKTLQQSIQDAVSDPKALIDLASDSHELWQHQGDATTLRSYMTALTGALTSLSEEDRIMLPAALLDLLFSMHDKLSEDLLQGYATTIHALHDFGDPDPVKRMESISRALETCRAWIITIPKAGLERDQMFALLNHVQTQAQTLADKYSDSHSAFGAQCAKRQQDMMRLLTEL